MAKKEKSLKRPNKVVALITYIIALVALLLGLFLPYGTNPDLYGTTDAIWAFQLPQALSKAVPVQGLIDLLTNAEGSIVGAPFTYSLPITFNGLIEGGYDLGALFTVLYALVVLAGIIALIPAIVSTFSKKSRRNTALSAASFIEVIAFLFVSFFVFVQLTNYTLYGSEILAAIPYQWSWPLLGAFGGTFVMLVVQSVFYKKGSGIFKFILLLLSTLALMLAIYDLGAIIPPIKEPLDELIHKTDSLFDGKLYYSVALGTSVIGILPVLMLFCGAEGGLPTITAAMDGMTAIQQTLFICTLILALLVLINFLLDAMGLGKTTKRYMLVSNVVRYTLELIAAALVIILPFFIDSATTGLMSIVIAVLALVALILNIIRLIRFDRKRAKINKAVAAEMKKANGVIDDEQPAEAPEVEEEKPFVYIPPQYNLQEETVEEEEPQVYNPVIYNGPTDDFIKTLTTEQKVEFSRVFLERQCGNINFIPEYNVGGSNDRFFNSVFIYFARLRSIVSDGLFNKMYEYGNLM
ncbi:MAG: hypothetical protein K2O89_06210 [Clostridia bacterium]|nr:hypothetical protein [Clostridia bacterium]